MKQDFRQAKYLNESGSKQGQYFINRLDYFEFHQYPSYKKHKVFTIIGFFLGLYLLSYAHFFSSVFWLVYVVGCLYLSYISCATLIILQRQICRYRGYIFYPKHWLAFFTAIQKEVDIQDFDSIATLEKK
ncbi:hypothetical protein AADZ91_02450 [Colwelliaceae bacterium 6441]